MTARRNDCSVSCLLDNDYRTKCCAARDRCDVTYNIEGSFEHWRACSFASLIILRSLINTTFTIAQTLTQLSGSGSPRSLAFLPRTAGSVFVFTFSLGNGQHRRPEVLVNYEPEFSSGCFFSKFYVLKTARPGRASSSSSHKYFTSFNVRF